VAESRAGDRERASSEYLKRRARQIRFGRHGVVGRAIVAGATVAVVLGLVGLAQSSAGQRLLRATGIVARDRGFVSLSFVSPETLPTVLTRTTSPVALPVTIANDTPHPRTVIWTVTVTGSRVLSGRSDLGGTILLGAGASRTLQLAFALRCAASTRISIALTTGQRLDVLADCAKPAGRRASGGTRRRSGGQKL
jgi:hypothetical protein